MVFYLQITNHESDFDSNSIALQEKGWCWSTMSATSLMLLIVPCSYTQIQGFFVKVLNCCHEVQWCWPSLLEFAFGTRQQRNCPAPTLWENTKPCMHAFFVWEWLRRISGKRWCWSSMRSTALPNMRKAATTLPDSDTGFVDRALGLIWPNSVRLQDVILTTEMCHTTWNARKRTY